MTLIQNAIQQNELFQNYSQQNDTHKNEVPWVMILFITECHSLHTVLLSVILVNVVMPFQDDGTIENLNLFCNSRPSCQMFYRSITKCLQRVKQDETQWLKK
jgi:hypothetical protein